MSDENFLRLISAIVISLLFIASIFWVRPLFYLILLFITIVMLSEWYDMAKSSNISLLVGSFSIPTSIIFITIMSLLDYTGWLVMTYFIATWSVDVFAMVWGKNIGGMKLAPVISPNKTVAGLVGGVLSSSIVVYLLQSSPYYHLPAFCLPFSKTQIVIATIILGVISQCSDLFVSYFKRKFKIKDTGNIIPGHGGMLDRFDSILLTSPIVGLWVLAKFNNFI